MKAQFVNGTLGRLYLSLYVPENQSGDWVICFPPFAEEMNKSRKMMSGFARKLADTGFAVAIPDLYGTGDSEGDFSDARWELWVSDYLNLLEWLTAKEHRRIHFWGIRLGCLLALEVASRFERNPDSFLFWQAVINGNLSMTQFLRLRMAATMMSGQKETVNDLRKKLLHEGKLEVAGYTLSHELLNSIDSLSMPDSNIAGDSVVNWYEITSNTDKPLPLPTRKIIDQWKAIGVEVTVRPIVGDQFWQTQEISEVPELIDNSLASLKDLQSPGESGLEGLRDLIFPEVNHEIPVQISCKNEILSAIHHGSESETSKGVLIVVGGPQYRVGSHRQFVQLSRALAASGFPVLRFDYRGMGDSTGSFSGFEDISEDINCAIDSFQRINPTVQEIIIWGLCDAATAASIYAHKDNRVTGLILLNPWVRNEQTEAKAYIKHYYVKRVLNKNFWHKLFSGKFKIMNSIKSLISLLNKSRGKRSDESPGSVQMSLADQMEMGFSLFKGKALLFLSGNDLTAAEFDDTVSVSKSFSELLMDERFTIERVTDADHTFSRREWKSIVESKSGAWINAI
ncbi:MAG: hydrolase 1, exosortase A system-associated [Sedimenticola sp.]